jgi:hypothetical protein
MTLLRRFIMLAVAAYVGVAAPALGGPRVEVDARTYDAGRADEATTVRHVFQLRNVGDAELSVDAVPGCSCTVAAFDRRIAPGAAGTIDVKLDTSGQQGRILKHVRVTTNDPAMRVFDVDVVADVVAAFRVAPTANPVIAGTRAELRPVTLTIASTDGAPFDVAHVLAEPTLAADARRETESRWALTVAARPSAPAGRSRPAVLLTTSHPRVRTVTVRVNLDIRADVAAEPNRVVLRGAAPAHVTVRRPSGAALGTVTARSSDPRIAAAVTPVTAGSVYDVAIRYSGPTARDVVRADVTLATDDPADGAIVIPVTARR